MLLFFSLILVCLPSFLPAQDSSQPETFVARAGNVFVSEREFLERFELTPGLYRHRKPQLEQEKLTLLYSMVAEKLLAQEALARNLDTDAVYMRAIGDLTRLLVRDELYQREIRAKVTVTAAEIKEGINRARTQLRMEYLFFPEETDARFVRSRITTGRDFDRYVIDSSMHVLRDTATVIWGDADTTIENAAYRIAQNGISPVIAAGGGSYILRRNDATPSSFYSAMPPVTLRERVVSRIRMRKEQAREDLFVEELLSGKTAFSPPVLFKRVAGALDHVFRASYRPPVTAISSEMGSAALVRLSDVAQETLVVAGTAAWTVEESIERLVAKGFAVNGDTVRGIAARLYSVFREWTRHELLAQEGLARGLDRTPSVQQRLSAWRDHYLAGMTERRVHDAVHVTDADVFAYLRSTDSSVSPPEVQLRILRTTTLAAMDEAFRQLEAGMPFDQAVRRFSVDPDAQRSGGLTPFFPVTERYPLGAIASRLEPGQFYGPLRDSSGYVYLQLAGRRTTEAKEDTALASRFARAREQARKAMERRAVTLFIAQSAAARGVQIYQDRLMQLKVTPLPMLAYRLLGFGGRMFEVPFIEPQLEWLDVEPPKQSILP